tara:strand:+ start:133 stop:267 length:135 start_codon:yes stop_codon:yes gene_type:complete
MGNFYKIDPLALWLIKWSSKGPSAPTKKITSNDESNEMVERIFE